MSTTIAPLLSAADTTRVHSTARLATSSTTRRLLLLALLAFSIRIVVVLCVYRTLPGSDQHEAFGWEQGWIARSLALGHGFTSPFQPLSDTPTALVAPLYPLLLASIFRVFGLYSSTSAFVALGLNAAFSASAVLPVYYIACAATISPTAAGQRGRLRAAVAPHMQQKARWIAAVPWAAAILWVLYPFSIYYSSAYLWDCTLTATLFAWVFYFSLRLRGAPARQWAAWGLLYGATALCNPSVLSLFPVLVLIGLRDRTMLVSAKLRRSAAATGMLMITLLPWMVRNVRVMHSPSPLRDGYWLEFWAGNAGDTSVSNPGWAHPASNPVELRRYLQVGEVRYMQEKRELGIHHVREHPLQFVLASGRRALRFWTGFWSFTAAYRAREPMDVPNVPFCTMLSLLAFTGTRELWRQKRCTAMAFVAVLVLFPLPYYLTHSSMDYRQPIEPEITVLVAIGGMRLLHQWQARRMVRKVISQTVLIGS